jgi:hypothetical protein
MANIPLAAIPNAPQTGDMSVLTPRGAIRTPDVGMFPMLNEGAFGAGSGMAVMGDAIAGLGNVAQQYQTKFAQASDSRLLSELELAASKEMAEYKAAILEKPEDQWMPMFQNGPLARMRERQENSRFSTQTGRDRGFAMLNAWEGSAHADITLGAQKSVIAKARDMSDAVLAESERTGNVEQHMWQLERDRESNLRSEGEIAAKQIRFELIQTDNRVRDFMNESPRAARDHFIEASKAGKSDLFPNLSGEDLAKYRHKTENHMNLHQGQRLEQAVEGIVANPLEWTPEAIDRYGEQEDLDAPQVAALKKARSGEYMTTEQGRAEFLANTQHMWQRVLNYDEVADEDRGGAQYTEILTDIIDLVPEGYRDQMIQDLKRIKNGGRARSDAVLANQISAVEDLAKWGMLGDSGGWKKRASTGTAPGKNQWVPKDPDKMEKVRDRQRIISDQLRDWHKRNPSASDEESKAEFKRLIDPNGVNAFQDRDGKGWFDWIWSAATFGEFAMQNVYDSPNLMTAGLGFRGGDSLRVDNMPPSADSPLPPIDTVIPQSSLPTSLPPAKMQIAATIAEEAHNAGLGDYTRHLMLLVAQESNFDPNVTMRSSSAKGVFQLLDGDRKAYGNDHSTKGQIKAGIKKAKQNVAAAEKALGRPPTPTELYVVHYQGIGAGPAILSDPSGDFRQTLDAAGGKGHAAKVMRANKWLAGITTNQDFIDWCEERMAKKAQAIGI